jgi:uncharacterized protein YndB with AHSA1/START domain
VRNTIVAQRRTGDAAIDTNEFILVSQWRIAAPITRVWDALHEPTGWPHWWPYVAAADKIAPGDVEGVGARYRFHWTSRLPYSIHIDTHVLEIAREKIIRAAASGDLQGEGTWRLREDGDATAVEYTWRVTLDRAWMRLFAPLLRPAFTWNHNAVMAAGEAGLRRFLQAPP